VKAKPKTAKRYDGFSADEKAAMKERVKETRRSAEKADEESALLAKLAEMPAADRARGERIHAVIKASAPTLTPKLWYGMPAYARDGKIVCFYQAAVKFKTRYATFGFNDAAHLDEGSMWPTAFAITTLTAAVEARIGELVEKAVS